VGDEVPQEEAEGVALDLLVEAALPRRRECGGKEESFWRVGPAQENAASAEDLREGSAGLGQGRPERPHLPA